MRKNVLEDIDTRIEILRTARELIEPIVDIPGKIQPSVCDGGSIRIDVRSTDQLHEARAYLRGVLGSWSDQVTDVFASMGRGLAIYSNDTPYELWLIFDVTNPPDGLVKPGCRFVERTTTDYDFVCDTQ